MFRAKAFVGLAALAFAASAQATVVISDFEPASYQSWQGLNGWFNYSSNPIAAVTVGSTTAMQITIANQYWGESVCQGWASPNLTSANFNANPTFEVDVMVPSSYTWGGLEFHFQVQSDGQDNWDSPAVAIDVTKKDVWQHISVDMSAGLPRTGTMSNLVTYFNPGWGPDAYTNQTIYVDNYAVSAVPEPAMLGLATAGSALLLRRKRRA